MVEGLTSSAADQGSVAGIAIDPDQLRDRRSHTALRVRLIEPARQHAAETRPDARNPGDTSGEAIPVPIPNTEVKLSSAEDTERAAFRENRSSPGFLRFRGFPELHGQRLTTGTRRGASAVRYPRLVSLSIEPAQPTEAPPGDAAAWSLATDPAFEASSAALATRRLCPYLEIVGGNWRSSTPDRDHRCGAVTPVALLSLEKQRRLCLTERHTSCSTYLAARGLDAAADNDPPSYVAVGPGRPVSPEAVTRWAIVRTSPVVLDHSRVPAVGSMARSRLLRQLGLAVLLVAAFAAIVLGRLSAPSAPGLVGALPSSSPTAPLAAGPVASPSFTPEATPPPASPSPTATRMPKPTQSPSPSPSTAPGTDSYTVHSGDTLYAIAIRFNTSVGAIKRLNHLTSNTLHVGQILKIPQASA